MAMRPRSRILFSGHKAWSHNSSAGKYYFPSEQGRIIARDTGRHVLQVSCIDDYSAACKPLVPRSRLYSPVLRRPASAQYKSPRLDKEDPELLRLEIQAVRVEVGIWARSTIILYGPLGLRFECIQECLRSLLYNKSLAYLLVRHDGALSFDLSHPKTGLHGILEERAWNILFHIDVCWMETIGDIVVWLTALSSRPRMKIDLCIENPELGPCRAMGYQIPPFLNLDCCVTSKRSWLGAASWLEKSLVNNTLQNDALDY